MQINEKQKRKLIEQAQNLYRKMYQVRCQSNPYAAEIDIRTFKEACYDMSCLVHYLAKSMYDIPDEENMIFHCIFKYNDYSGSHYFNYICGKVVDSTIMQFDNLSPYDDHDDCYTELEKCEYSDMDIQNEICLFEKYREEKMIMCNRKSIFCKIIEAFKK